MGFRDDMRAIAYNLRSLAGDPYEIRPYTVKVVTRTWTGNVIGEGSELVATTTITEANGQSPKVRFLNDEQLALGGLPKGSIQVGPITPDFPGGGTTWETISGGGVEPGEMFHYILTGPEFPTGARFLLVGGNSDRAFRYMVTLRPLSAA